MTRTQNTQTITRKYIVFTFLAVVFTWLLHEFGHWMTGEFLGYNMVMTLNSSYHDAASTIDDAHTDEAIISMGGPIITLIQALVFYLLIKRSRNTNLFPFLLTCFYMRLLAGGMNLINVNDEGRVSNHLGLGTYTVPVIVSAILLYLVYDVIRRLRLTTKFIVFSFLLIILFSSILILVDQALQVQVIHVVMVNMVF